MYIKTIIRFGFCDIQNNQGLGKDYESSILKDDFHTAQSQHPNVKKNYKGSINGMPIDVILITNYTPYL